MTELRILRPDDAGTRGSPEIGFAYDLCEQSAREVYERVEVVDPTALDQLPGGGPDGPDLLILRQPVYLSGASLGVMRAALEAGATSVVPTPFHLAAGTEAAGTETLMDYRALEHRLLTGSLPPAGSAEAQAGGAVLLISGVELARETPPPTISELQAGSAAITVQTPAQAGFVFEFTDYYGQVREDVLPHLPAHFDDALVIGCGRGLTGAMLRERIGCRVTGVEIFGPMAEEARDRLSRVIVGDAGTVDLGQAYDVVLMLDVLEHLVDPVLVLARVRDVLREHGRLVLSVPNVGHASIVRDLVRGHWDYVPMGLLCWTHLRFFTQRTLTEMLRRSGFTRIRVEAQSGPIPEDAAFLLADSAADRESLATRGWIVVAQR